MLARTRWVLDSVRALLEHEGIPVSTILEREKTPPLHRIREISLFLEAARQRASELDRASKLLERVGEGRTREPHPWVELLRELLEAWKRETSDAELPVGNAVEFLYEGLAQRKRESRIGNGVFLGTVHSAKGLEFPHVLVPAGGWDRSRTSGDAEEERRVFYVGMTRAKENLALIRRADLDHPHLQLVGGSDVLRREAPDLRPVPVEIRSRRYEILGLRDLFIDLAGHRRSPDPIHDRIAGLEPGAPLRMVERSGGLLLELPDGGTVARLSSSAARRWAGRLGSIEQIRVVAVVRRFKDDTGSEFREEVACESWEVPLAEVVWRDRTDPEIELASSRSP